MRHLLVLCCYYLIYFARHDGIFEERAGRAKFGHFGQFLLTNADYCFANRHGRWIRADFATQIAVIQLRLEMFVEPVHDVRNDILSAEGVLENTVAVAVLTFGIGEDPLRSIGDGNSPYGLNHIFRFHAVRTDVLNRRRSHFARNITEVFESRNAHIA